ncbi:MAG: hypothetical protein GC162_02000 [Planctomycetes bacterium]|nr:hypothetical protein [Planctomycetota bacterium]
MTSSPPQPADPLPHRLFVALAAALLLTACLYFARNGRSTVDAPINYTINLNTADAPTLQLLPGVGPALAQRIIADRAEHGPYRSIADLARVSGIGPKLTERIRPYVSFGEQGSGAEDQGAIVPRSPTPDP